MVGHDPDRRQFLRAGAALATAAAGCLGEDRGEDTPTPGPGDDTRSETNETGTWTGGTPSRTFSCRDGSTAATVDVPSATGGAVTGDLGLTVDRARLVESVIASYDVFNSVERPDRAGGDGPGTQILELLVTVDGEADHSDLGAELVVDGEVHDSAVTETATYYNPLAESEAVAVPVPVAPASEATVQFTRGSSVDEEVVATWTVAPELLSWFDSAPSFAVRHAEMVPCETATLGLTVGNDGDRDGVFRGLAVLGGYGDVSYPFAFDVPEGESVTQATAVEWPDGDQYELEEWSPDARSFVFRHG